ncbi:hypothetical protein LLS1_03580 [Leifsonia sp. LS1]|nr:hypothetical protein LLS1_03580 [Leifsonia sp. LS1]
MVDDHLPVTSTSSDAKEKGLGRDDKPAEARTAEGQNGLSMLRTTTFADDTAIHRLRVEKSTSRAFHPPDRKAADEARSYKSRDEDEDAHHHITCSAAQRGQKSSRDQPRCSIRRSTPPRPRFQDANRETTRPRRK